jgi:hypothetical protein
VALCAALWQKYKTNPISRIFNQKIKNARKTNPNSIWVAPSSAACGCFLQNEPKPAGFRCHSGPRAGIQSDLAGLSKIQNEPKLPTIVIPNPPCGVRNLLKWFFLNFDICSLLFDMNL